MSSNRRRIYNEEKRKFEITIVIVWDVTIIGTHNSSFSAHFIININLVKYCIHLNCFSISMPPPPRKSKLITLEENNFPIFSYFFTHLTFSTKEITRKVHKINE